MEDSKIVDYLNILLKSNIEHEHLLLMVYDLLHAKYGVSPLSDIDTLRQPKENPEVSQEYVLPKPRFVFKSLPAAIVSSYAERVNN